MRKVSLIILVFAVAMLISLPAWAADLSGPSGPISATELKALMGSDKVVPIYAGSKKENGFIPGSVNIPIAEFYETIDGIPKMAASREKLADIYGKAGITPDTYVVFYSSADDPAHPMRGAWVSGFRGHKKAYFLEGGFEKWISSGFEVSAETTIPKPAVYDVNSLIQDDTFEATLDEVLTAYKTKSSVLVDCRNSDFQSGKEGKAVIYGTIPGSSLITLKDVLNEDFTFKPNEELQKVFAEKGIYPDTNVTTFCNTGTNATVIRAALIYVLGYENVQNFDGSMLQWALKGLAIASQYDHFVIGARKAQINGQLAELSAAPYLQDGRTYVPASDLGTSLGYVVTICNGSATFTRVPGGDVLTVDTTVTAEGINFVPLRFVAEELGFKVDWSAAGNDAKIFTP